MLQVKRINGFYCIVRGNNSYYFECYRERWSAQATVAGLESLWEESTVDRDNDHETLFLDDPTGCRKCAVEKAYIEKHGRCPIEISDEKARALGYSWRLGFEDGTPFHYVKTIDQVGPAAREYRTTRFTVEYIK